jgi:hypothetical protein
VILPEDGSDASILTDIEEIGEEAFRDLDPAGGSAACYGRLRQRQSDQRWGVRYLRMGDEDSLQAVTPVCTYRGRQWPDPAYDIESWPRSAPQPHHLGAESVLLVGGCSDRRSSLHVRRGATAPLWRKLIVELARLATAEDRCLVFPYVYGDTRTALAVATGDSITWTALSREARLYDVSNPQWETSLGSRVAGVLRHDRKIIAAACVEGAVSSWPQNGSAASEMIAEHNERKGRPDHPAFVQFRYSEWQQCDGVELIVFSAAASGVSGVLTALVWQDELELCEIGLTGAHGPARLAVYLDLLFHRPLDFARGAKLRDIRLGYAAEIPKKSRGAAFEVLFGGVLDHTLTRRIADGYH